MDLTRAINAAWSMADSADFPEIYHSEVQRIVETAAPHIEEAALRSAAARYRAIEPHLTDQFATDEWLIERAEGVTP